MAIIQTIRDKYAKLAGGLIVVALIGFVLMDLGKSSFSASTVAAKVNGEKIDIQDYINYGNSRIEQQKQQNQNQPLNPAQEEQVRDEAWSEMVADILFAGWKEKMGVVVTPAEFKDMFSGAHADQNIKQMFINPETKEYDMEQAVNQYNQLESTTNDTMKRTWAEYKANMMKVRWQSKAGSLIAASLYAPKDVLDAQYKLRNEIAQVEMVQLPLTMIGDDKVTVSEKEINDYIQANKDRFIAKIPLLEMDVVQIPIIASKADSTAFYHKMDSIKTAFTSATNPEEFASIVTGQNVVAQTYTKDVLASLPNKDELLNAAPGTVVGPFVVQGNNYGMARVMEKETLPDSIEVRHILINTKDNTGAQIRTKEEAQKLVDSLAAAIKAGANFDTLAANFSDDDGSKNNGGKYTFTAGQKSSLTKAFGDFAFSGAVGESKVVFVDQNYTGYHYVEILKRSSTTQAASKMVMLFQNLEISEDTKRGINNIANQFAVDASKGAGNFDKETQKLGLQKFPVMANPNSKLVGSLGVSGELIAWATDAKIGDVSPIVIMDNNYVIASLKGKSKKGEIAESTQLKKDVEQMLKNKKKAEMLLKEYNGKGDLNAIASGAGLTPVIVDTVTFNGANNPILNSEVKVLGYIFSKEGQVGKVSPGIAGRQGVYFVKINSKNPVTNTEPRNLVVERKAMTAYIANPYRYFVGAKTQDADIDDRRYKFINKGL